MSQQPPRPYWVHSNPDPTPEPDPLCTVCEEREPKAPSNMCGGCFGRLRADVTVLVGAHIWLGITMLSTSTQPGTTIHIAAGPRIPLRLDLHDARQDITGKLTSWARTIAEQHQPALAGPADTNVETIGRWLRERLHWVSEQDWGHVMATELRETATAVYGLVPWNRHRRDMPLPCPGCRFLTLSLYGGDEVILCRNRECGRVMSWADYWTEVRSQNGGFIPAGLINPSTNNGAAA